jgi:CxxC motif-containing protein (DUF1111 family)
MNPWKRAARACVGLVAVVVTTVVAQSTFQQGRAPRQRPRDTPIIHRSGIAFGDPIAGLTDAQVADFAAGLEEFTSVDTPESGLGPIYNNNSCAACHSVPVIGGGSTIFVTRFGRTAGGHFDPLESEGGSLLQQFAIDPAVQEVIPADANVVAHRQTSPLFGFGLIEAIPDATILANAAQSKPDGISGRASIVQDVSTGQTRIGRFGWKAQQATLLSFAADAYVNEMGITNRFFPNENAPNGNTALLAQYDKVGDPEDSVDPATGKADIDRLADYMRLLGPPPVGKLTLTALAGAVVFAQTGCQNCHTAVMQTGASSIAALDHKIVPLFSDLLLHDMGSLGDGIVQGAATESEIKTAPLWGLRARTAFLHDGRATTVNAAIQMHDGEAARVRDRYSKLKPSDQQHLLEFLGTL